MWNPELKIWYIAFKEAHSDQNLQMAAIAELSGLHQWGIIGAITLDNF